MPLSPAQARERLHGRRYEFDGYRREDGLWDIEGRLTDAKTYGFKNRHRGWVEAGEPIHDMWIRLTLDEDFVVRDIEAVTDGSPYAVCPQVTPNFKRLVGVKIASGWRRAIRERVGGAEGCTHLVEMLGAMATVAFQTLYPALSKKEKGAQRGRPGGLIDSCYAYRSDGPVVREQWPELYTGKSGE